MNIRVHFATLSVGASVDQQTGSLSIFEVIEEIRAPQVPLTLPTLVLSILAEKKSNGPFQGKVMIHLLPPDQKQQLLGSADLQVPADQKKMKAVFRFGAFPVMQFGQHRFVLSWLDAAGAKVGEAIADFEVIQVQMPQGQAGNIPPAQGPKGLPH